MMKLRRIRLFGSLFLVTLVAVKTAWAQDAAKQGSPSEGVAQETPAIGKPQKNDALQPHPFWDKENRWLFGGVGAARTLDYFSTLNMRRRGRQEIFLTNDAVEITRPLQRSKPLRLASPSALPISFTATDTTSWSDGHLSFTLGLRPPAPCATTASRLPIP